MRRERELKLCMCERTDYHIVILTMIRVDRRILQGRIRFHMINRVELISNKRMMIIFHFFISQSRFNNLFNVSPICIPSSFLSKLSKSHCSIGCLAKSLSSRTLRNLDAPNRIRSDRAKIPANVSKVN